MAVHIGRDGGPEKYLGVGKKNKMYKNNRYLKGGEKYLLGMEKNIRGNGIK